MSDTKKELDREISSAENSRRYAAQVNKDPAAWGLDKAIANDIASSAEKRAAIRFRQRLKEKVPTLDTDDLPPHWGRG